MHKGISNNSKNFKSKLSAVECKCKGLLFTNLMFDNYHRGLLLHSN